MSDYFYYLFVGFVIVWALYDVWTQYVNSNRDEFAQPSVTERLDNNEQTDSNDHNPNYWNDGPPTKP